MNLGFRASGFTTGPLVIGSKWGPLASAHASRGHEDAAVLIHRNDRGTAATVNAVPGDCLEPGFERADVGIAFGEGRARSARPRWRPPRRTQRCRGGAPLERALEATIRLGAY